MIKEAIYQEKTILNICASNNRVSEYMGQNLKLKGEIVDQLEHYIQQQQSIHPFLSAHGIHQDGLNSGP